MARFLTNGETATLDIKRFDIQFFESFQNIRGKMPEKTLQLLNINHRIKKIDKTQMKVFANKIDNFDEPQLKKKINSELNKLTADNFDSIYAKVSEIYKNRKVLLEYIIENLLHKAINQKTYIELYVRFFMKFHNESTTTIFDNFFKNILSGINNVDASEETKGTYATFCKYLQDKTRFSCVFLFINELYSKQIIKKDMLYQYINFLKTKLDESKDDSDKCAFYCEIFCIVFSKIDKKILRGEVDYIKQIKKYSTQPRVRFMFMDLQDLL